MKKDYVLTAHVQKITLLPSQPKGSICKCKYRNSISEKRSDETFDLM